MQGEARRGKRLPQALGETEPSTAQAQGDAGLGGLGDTVQCLSCGGVGINLLIHSGMQLGGGGRHSGLTGVGPPWGQARKLRAPRLPSRLRTGTWVVSILTAATVAEDQVGWPVTCLGCGASPSGNITTREGLWPLVSDSSYVPNDTACPQMMSLLWLVHPWDTSLNGCILMSVFLLLTGCQGPPTPGTEQVTLATGCL